MVALLSELWRCIAFLLGPENSIEVAGERLETPPAASALAGLAKALLWTGLAVLAGLGLAQLGG